MTAAAIVVIGLVAISWVLLALWRWLVETDPFCVPSEGAGDDVSSALARSVLVCGNGSAGAEPERAA